MAEDVTRETLARELFALHNEAALAPYRARGWTEDLLARDWATAWQEERQRYEQMASGLLARYDLIRRGTGGPLPEVAITRILVRSSYVESIGYNNQHRVLEVVYRGPVCRYAEVPSAVWTEIHGMVTKGRSVGRYLAEHIQPYYACTTLEPAVEEVLS